VGEGDVLEIVLQGETAAPALALEALASLRGNGVEVEAEAMTLRIRALNAVNLLPEVVARLKNAQIALGEARLRENTLEDVFIRLKGRRLRE
jgi:hypothetical protein